MANQINIFLFREANYIYCNMKENKKNIPKRVQLHCLYQQLFHVFNYCNNTRISYNLD